MPRARKKKAKPARKRSATRRKALAQQSSSNWQIGAGIFALAVLLGAGAYVLATNDDARLSMASLVNQIEVPQAVKELPGKVKENLPDMSSLTNPSSNSATAGPNESAPATN
ncbi:MAG: hypothetical protein KF835_11060 [Xanthobacteraceae bacterium]|nr:hypothetical protein [Xanthobacteraceae bacterium]